MTEIIYNNKYTVYRPRLSYAIRWLISRTCLSRCVQLAPPRKRAMRPLCRRGENTRRFPVHKIPRTLSFREIRIRLLDMLQRYHRIRLMSRRIMCAMNSQYSRMILRESQAISKAKWIIADFLITGNIVDLIFSFFNYKYRSVTWKLCENN